MKRIFFLGIVISYTSLFSFVDDKDYSSAFIVGGLESKNCFISFVVIHGNRYIVKQKKDTKKQLGVVRESLAAYIAESFDFSHRVKLIPPNIIIAGKMNQSWPATLHTIVPGTEVQQLIDSKYYNLHLEQHKKPTGECGLDEEIIHQITWHKQLSKIVALDLFIGNAGRHGGNLFYDKKTDIFWIIDMDNAFRYDLCRYACENLKKMIEHNKKFSKKEIYALIRLKTILTFLHETYSPQDLIDRLYAFGHDAGFLPKHPLYKKLILIEDIIKDSHESCCKLLSLLDDIIYGFFKRL